jgi:drug/metabolite transporter (DMT)-like permease
VGSLGIILHFHGVKHLPLADVSMISAATPIFTVFFAWIILRESVGIVDIVNLVLVFAGIVLIVRPPFIFGGGGDSETDQVNSDTEYWKFIAALLVLLGAMLQANVYIFLRMLKGINKSGLNSIFVVLYVFEFFNRFSL